ncbi:MAG: acyl-CoA dehydrogenase [Candidatus Binatia bacterium]|nr:acyl-CoA dehydrogenase [Candidatus Binatia bacterium]MDG2009194.1 acyl-CoA dehydrogenase [Candidatus Binatia bacterium]HAC80474.1 acyl-CoA dehydrogenase [Deltaproteobacteria bacterium]
MALVLTEEQQILQKTAQEFIAANAPLTQLRKLRDSNDDLGFSRELWKEMAQLGWVGLAEEEAYGGSGLGAAELGILFEECGRTLAATPMLSTAVLGAGCIRLGGSSEIKSEILPAVALGDKLLALAMDEGPRFSPYSIETTATKAEDGYTVSGRKAFVLDGHTADHIVVVARSSGASGDRDGLTLLLVDRAAPGLKIQRTTMIDTRNAAIVELAEVSVPASRVLGEVGHGADILDLVIETGTACLCAEMLGAMSYSFDTTVSYLKTREQFGVKIGSFQGLKHRAAHMFAELELARSVSLEVLRAIDENGNDVPTLVSVAKARCSDAANLLSREMLQMHGGIGMTDEADIGFFLKRAQVTEQTLGNGDYHRDRFASLQGY